VRSSPTRLLAVTVGGLYLVGGIAAFVISAGMGFFADPGRLLVGVFSTNPSAAVLDILIGAALVMAGLATVAAARIVTTSAGTLFLVLGLAGLFVIGTDVNVLALNGADNALHFASAVILLGVGLGAERSVTRAVAS